MAAHNGMSERACLRVLIRKQAIPLILLAIFTWLAAGQIGNIDLIGTMRAVQDIAVWQWLAAVLFCAASFFAVGRMEELVHRLMQLPTGTGMAQITGIASIGTAQVTGFGLLTGTLARWRMLPGANLWTAARLTGTVSLSFMAGLAVIAATSVLLVRPDLPRAEVVAAIGLLAALGLAGLSVWRPRALMRLWMPSLGAQAALLGWVVLDTIAAALTLYVLIPDALMPPLDLFYVIFLLALGAGLLGMTPGGVGPFEMMFLACLPGLPEAPVLAAIMGYRIVYFALPGVVAAVLLLLAPRLNRRLARSRARARIQPLMATPQYRRTVGALSFTALRAEAGLMRQGEFELLINRQSDGVGLVAPTQQSLIMLSGRLRRDQDRAAALVTLAEAAKHRYLRPAIYKCDARMALTARRLGWRVLRIAQEAHVTPARYDPLTPAHRQLRRQLRKAEKAGVRVRAAGSRLPLDRMQVLAADWAQRQGYARGFSMGQFDPGYVTGQRVYLAEIGKELVGFLTLHECWSQHAVDLMCHSAAAPAGTMHMLMHHAIETARDEGCLDISLAAVPALADNPALPVWMQQRLNARMGTAGLKRFKSCFGPVWQPLYLAAPGYTAMTLAGLDLADRITRPRLFMSQS